MKLFPCSSCGESFDTGLQLRDHQARAHKPGAPAAAPKPQPTQQEELLQEYDLKACVESLGQLVPVTRAADGTLIDGNHRLKIDPAWRQEILPQIDTPIKTALAQLAINFNRRRMTPAELRERFLTLAEAGAKPADMLALGLKPSTVYAYWPAQYKDAAKSAAGKAGAQAKGAPGLEQKTSANTSSITEKARIEACAKQGAEILANSQKTAESTPPETGVRDISLSAEKGPNPTIAARIEPKPQPPPIAPPPPPQPKPADRATSIPAQAGSYRLRCRAANIDTWDDGLVGCCCLNPTKDCPKTPEPGCFGPDCLEVDA